jgi:hypothetical protein
MLEDLVLWVIRSILQALIFPWRRNGRLRSFRPVDPRLRLALLWLQIRTSCYQEPRIVITTANRPLDDWFHPSWLSEVRRIQMVGR